MIINLTQHAATEDQIAAGVVDLTDDKRAELQNALTVDDLPSREQIQRRADIVALLALCNGHGLEDGDSPIPAQAMIGGAPWLMSALESSLMDLHVEPVYAFSRRESVEEMQADGSVRKSQVFRHLGFVRPYDGVACTDEEAAS